VYLDGGLAMELEWKKQIRMISCKESALKFTILRLKLTFEGNDLKERIFNNVVCTFSG
jgi:hypothetical protein